MYTYRNKNERSQTVVSPDPVPRLDYLPNWERTDDREPARTAGDLAEAGPVQIVKGDQHTSVTELPQGRKTPETGKAPAKRATKAATKAPANTDGGDGQGAGDKKA